MLENIESLPTNKEVTIFVKQNFEGKGVLSADDEVKKTPNSKKHLDNNEVQTAWKVLLVKQ